MKKLSIFLTGLLIAVGLFGYSIPVSAQGYTISSGSFWKRIGTALVPLGAWSLGDVTHRLSKVWADAMDVTSVVIGGAVTGALKVGGLLTAYGGLTGPTVTATSTGDAITTPGRLVAGSTSATRAFVGPGSATLPSITFGGDSNTGFHNASPDNLTMDLGGSGYVSWSVVAQTNWQSILPGTSNTYNLGTLGTNWKSLFVKNVSSTNIDALDYVSTTNSIIGVGSASNPSLSFQGDRNTGAYQAGDGQFAITSNGTQRFKVSGGTITITGDVLSDNNDTRSLGALADKWKYVFATNVSSTNIDALGYVSTTNIITRSGSAVAPSITFQGDPDTGFYRSLSNQIAFTAGGSQIAIFDGSAAYLRTVLPAVTNSYNLGSATLYWNKIFARNVSSTYLSATGFVSSTKFYIASNGTNAAPAVAFTNDLGTGISIPSAGSMDLNTSGQLRMRFSSSGNASLAGIYPGTNNTYDLGRAALSWANIYASGTIRTTGDIAARNVTSTGNLYTGPITIQDPGAPNYFINFPLSAGTAGTQQSAIVSIADKFLLGFYGEQSGTANVAQNPALRVYAPLETYSGQRIYRKETDATTYTMTVNDFYLAVSTTGAAVSISLPSVTSVKSGTEFKIFDRKGNAASKNITVTANGTNTFNLNGTSAKLTKNFTLLDLVSDGVSNWEAVSSTRY